MLPVKVYTPMKTKGRIAFGDDFKAMHLKLDVHKRRKTRCDLSE